MIKVSVIGDIMVEPNFLKQVENDGKYDFYPALEPLKHIFTDSDYVIGNLETPLAGEDAVYARVHQESNPEIPVPPGDEHYVLDTSLDKVPHLAKHLGFLFLSPVYQVSI